ncbi:sterile alpha motif domain-containing protein 7 [Bufo bufo]|uniref:sterile alpha motif domain-containing protein 7 n=1 Tax=Bufo bufo TaxID=8384 RepID=UPI001ABDA325|nr:sterile alpha motif domain-containing protein 7 [Bufo bufo]
MSMISDQTNLEGKHLYQLTGCIPTAELRQKQEIMMRNQMMSVNPQVVVPVQQRMPFIPTQFDSRLLDRGELLPSNDLMIPNDTRQLHLSAHFGSSIPGHSSVMPNRAFSTPGYSNFLHTEPLDFMARRQELLQKQALNRMDMDINAMYHQREIEKSHRKGFVDMDTPFLYHGMPSNPVAFRGRQMCPEGQLPSDLFVHRNALDILHGSSILKTSPYTPINSLQRERARRPGRRAGNPKMTESNMSVPKSIAENKPQSSPSATEEEKEEKKDEDAEALTRCDQEKSNRDSATEKTVMETQDNQEKTSNPVNSMSNRSRTGADKELTNPGPTFDDRYLYQSPVHLSTSPFSFPVAMNPSLLAGGHGLFLNREEMPTLQDIRKWSSQDVYNFVSSLPGCSAYAQVFKDHDIDGLTLPLLTEDHLLDTMGLKLGPALKIRTQICCRLGNIFHMTSLPLPGPVSSAAPVPSDQPPEVISPTTCSNSNTTAPSPCAHDSDTLRATDIATTENKENPCDLSATQSDFAVNFLKV